jgi:hypothetical protein
MNATNWIKGTMQFDNNWNPQTMVGAAGVWNPGEAMGDTGGWGTSPAARAVLDETLMSMWYHHANADGFGD